MTPIEQAVIEAANNAALQLTTETLSQLKTAAMNWRNEQHEKTAEAISEENLIANCVEIVRTEQQASVSLFQRRLRLGYGRACRVMDEIERRGIVGPAKGSEPRDIFIDEEGNKI